MIFPVSFTISRFFRGLTMFLPITKFTELFDYLYVPEPKEAFVYTIGWGQLNHHSGNGLRLVSRTKKYLLEYNKQFVNDTY